MRSVKLKYVGFWDDMDPKQEFIYRILSKHYRVEICEDADYIICGCFGRPYDYCKYPQVRIMMVGENYVPDFNLVDYAICRYPIDFFDRCFYLPGCMEIDGRALALEEKTRDYGQEFVQQKEYFANFIARHESEYDIRGGFFQRLCEYKRVESCGSYLNNMPDGYVVNWKDDSKTNFQRKCKFSLCFESTKHLGFITEKITDAFFADTIPIYYGSPTVSEIFNPNAFLDYSDFPSDEAMIERIKEIDSNDEMYLQMMRQPILNDNEYFTKLSLSMEEYLLHIFEQPIQDAYRRSRVYSPMAHENYLLRPNLDYVSTIELAKKLKKRISNKLKNMLIRM